jgi:hypothetical protein
MYGISVRTAPSIETRWIKSDEILAMLDPTNPEHARHIAWIEQIERKGIRYSNEDFDVLSAAFRAGRAA